MRDSAKLKQIIQSNVKNGLFLKNLNHSAFQTIIEEYNRNLPVNFKMRNTKKNRKMIYITMKRFSQKQLKENCSSDNTPILNEDEKLAVDVLSNFCEFINTETTDYQQNHRFEQLNVPMLNEDEKLAVDVLTSLCEFINTENFDHQSFEQLEIPTLNDDEKIAVDVLTNLCGESEHGMQLQYAEFNDDEKLALDNLLSLCEGMDVNGMQLHHSKLEKGNIVSFLQEEMAKENEFIITDKIPVFEPRCNVNNGEEYSKSEIKKIESLLTNFVDHLKGMLEQLFDRYFVNLPNGSRNTNNLENKINYFNSDNDNVNILDIVESNVLNKNSVRVENDVLLSESLIEKTGKLQNRGTSVLHENSDIIKKDTSFFENSENINNSNVTLGPFETSDRSLNLEEFEIYRKDPNPKEKVNISVLRPKGIATQRTRKFKRNILDCKFKINPNLIFQAEDDDKLKLTKNKLVLDVIRQEYLKINNSCIISFYSAKRLKSGFLAYGYCNFKDCSEYRYKINADGNVLVSRSGRIVHAEGEKRVGQIRGVTRKIVKKALAGKSAYMYRKEEILKAADDIAKSGNLQNIQNLSTLRKCKSEGNADKWLHPDPFYEVFLMQQNIYKDYIQHVASPLAIYCWGRATFVTFAVNPQILKDANYTIHFDASGQSVRQIKCAEKRVLIYKIVMRIKKEKMVIPIVTAILSRHTLNDICSILDKLKLYCIENKLKFLFFQRVCTDVSYGLFGAVLKSCNNQNISEYLMNCYNCLQDKSLNKKPNVIIQWCKAHYIHIMCKDLNNKIGKNNFLRHFIKHVLTMAFDLKTLEECIYWFKHLFIVLLFPKQNFMFRDSFNILRKNILPDNDTESENINIIDDDISNLESIASRSPFKKLFLNTYDEICNVIKNVSITGEDNKYKNDDICNFIINKYIPFLPMWTNIMGIMIDPSGDHISNAPVEFSFFLQKHIILKQRSLRPGDFIRIDRKENISTLKDLRYRYNMFEEIEVDDAERKKLYLNMPEETKTLVHISEEHCYSRLSKHQITKLSEDLQPEEQWNKKDPKKRKAINPKHLLNSKKPKKFLEKTKNVQDIIKTEPDDIKNTAVVSKTSCEPSSSLNIRINIKNHYYIFRFNDLYNSINPKTKQIDIGFYNFLDREDWESLKEDRCLTNLVLDCAILCFIKESFKNVLSLPCQINEINFEKVNKLLSHKPRMLFVPVLQNAHYNLCIIKPATSDFIFIDSMHDLNGKSHFEKLESYTKQKWKFINILERDKQNDFVSCGIFVILYIISFLKDLPMTNLPNPNHFRDKIKSVLIKHADDCSNFCCHCASSKKSKTKCSLCNYNVCKDCIIDIYNNSFTICKICSNKVLS